MKIWQHQKKEQFNNFHMNGGGTQRISSTDSDTVAP